MEEGLEDLACLLPDLVGKLERMKVDILQQLLMDLPVKINSLIIEAEWYFWLIEVQAAVPVVCPYLW